MIQTRDQKILKYILSCPVSVLIRRPTYFKEQILIEDKAKQYFPEGHKLSLNDSKSKIIST